jgi:hypothetical protein
MTFSTDPGITQFDAVLYLLDNSGNILYCDDDNNGIFPYTAQFTTVLSPNSWYFIVVDGYYSFSVGQYGLVVTSP